MELDDPPFRERLRRKTGLSSRQWTWAVTLVFSIPYPLFVYFFLTFDVSEPLFLLATLVYSLVVLVLYVVL